MGNLKLMENGLIKVYKTDTGEYVVDGRELWQGLGSKQRFADWIKNVWKSVKQQKMKIILRFIKK